MKSEKLRTEILKLSEGVLSTVVDIVLWEMVYLSEAATTFSRNTWEPQVKANRFLESVNYETIKRAIEKARQKGWIKRTNKRRAWPQITAAGQKRLTSLIPTYDEQRVWDNRLYLVTYDIPEEKKKDRELLREYLKILGATIVQESVWLTPYNPRIILQEFIDERKLSGTIIISDIGKDGSIGDEDIKDLVVRLYRLDEINKAYKKFIEKYENSKITTTEVYFAYLKILRDDPQLPFELLPSYWLGERAYKVFQQISSKLNSYISAIA